MAHGELCAEEFGWDTSFQALACRIVADYASNHDATREAAWIAESEVARVGCVFCVRADERTALLRILVVDPSARGAGVVMRLVDTCVDFAQAAGYTRLKLWTNDPRVSARQIYLARGFELVEEEPHHTALVQISSARPTS